MWELLGREPKTIFHFTRRDCVESIKNDRQLKKFKDLYVFACESYEDCLRVIDNTILNPKACFIDFDGLPKPYSTKNLNDYVIIELKTRYSNPVKWYRSKSAGGTEIDNITVAYKGNLPIAFVREIEIDMFDLIKEKEIEIPESEMEIVID